MRIIGGRSPISVTLTLVLVGLAWCPWCQSNGSYVRRPQWRLALQALHKSGFANQATSTHLKDGLALANCAITNICHCAPPQNKPTRDEILTCQPWFEALVTQLPVKVFLAFGQIAWRGVIDFMRDTEVYSGPIPKFGHAATFRFDDGRILLGSYHPSQQNTFTGNLQNPCSTASFAKLALYKTA